MIEFHFSIDLEKCDKGVEAFKHLASIQSECAMALLALERIKLELLSIDYDDTIFSEDIIENE